MLPVLLCSYNIFAFVEAHIVILSQNDSNDTPAVIPLYHQKDQQRSHHTFHLSFKVIPNRIFVGGFGSTVRLRHRFSNSDRFHLNGL